MRNPDLENKQNQIKKEELFNAIRSGNDVEQQEAFANFLEHITEEAVNEMKAEIDIANVTQRDREILVKRGVLPELTSEEYAFFNEAVSKKGFDRIQEEVFPKTIIDQIFDDITQKHPLISEVKSINTHGIVKWIKAKSNAEKRGYWGEIIADINQIILNGFESVEIDTRKLSGFVAVPKAYFDLGPEWLAKFVTMTIYEIFAVTLEEAIVNGEGPGKNEPVGLLKKLTGAIDGVHQDKPLVEVKDFSPIEMGGLRAGFAEAKTDNGQISIVVHPETYWTKVFPTLVHRRPEAGTYVRDILPTGERIVQTYAVPKDIAIMGNLKNYELYFAGNSSLKRYDQTLAIQDMDLYIFRTFVTGLPNDPNAFFILDLKGIEGGTVPELEVEEDELIGG